MISCGKKPVTLSENEFITGFLKISCQSEERGVCLSALVSSSTLQAPESFCQRLDRNNHSYHYIGANCPTQEKSSCASTGVHIYFSDETDGEQNCREFAKLTQRDFYWTQRADESFAISTQKQALEFAIDRDKQMIQNISNFNLKRSLSSDLIETAYE